MVTFTEEILNGKLHFLCSVIFSLFNNLLDSNEESVLYYCGWSLMLQEGYQTHIFSSDGSATLGMHVKYQFHS